MNLSTLSEVQQEAILRLAEIANEIRELDDIIGVVGVDYDGCVHLSFEGIMPGQIGFKDVFGDGFAKESDTPEIRSYPLNKALFMAFDSKKEK